MDITNVPVKMCNRCGGPKPVGKQGRKYCDACQIIRHEERKQQQAVLRKEWQIKNRAKINEQNRNRKRKPCPICGGPKGEGERRRYCDACASIAAERQKEKARQRTRNWEAENEERVKVRKAAYQREHANTATARARMLTARVKSRYLNANIVEPVDPLAVYVRDRGICGICGNPVEVNALTIDHIVALRHGGEHSYANVQLAHAGCNASKHMLHERCDHPDHQAGLG